MVKNGVGEMLYENRTIFAFGVIEQCDPTRTLGMVEVNDTNRLCGVDTKHTRRFHASDFQP